MKRWDIINKYINKYNYKSYLEIGTQKNATFDKINIKKTSVDPDSNAKADFVMTSDKFFEQVSDGVKWDMIFIDGLHHHEQVTKDIDNALLHLSENGTIICHDMNPTTYEMQAVPRIQKEWTGDCFKAFVRIRTERDDLECFVINTDYGCGVIRKSSKVHQKLDIKGTKIDYKNLEINRKEWLNLKSTEQWLNEDMDEKIGNYRVWEFIPYSITKQYGKACNECFELIPSDDDWGIMADCDSLHLTPSHIHMVRKAIDAKPDAGLFVCRTNRVGNRKQVYDMSLFEDMDIKKHRKIALKLASEPLSFTKMNGDVSGYFLCLKKSVWKNIGGFKETNILGVDTALGRAIKRSGREIFMINNLYMFHYYRWLETTKWRDHLR